MNNDEIKIERDVTDDNDTTEKINGKEDQVSTGQENGDESSMKEDKNTAGSNEDGDNVEREGNVEEEGFEASEDAVESTDADGQSTEGKKGFFKKEKKKDKKDELIEELTDKYKRTFAEFDNFRKRSEKEKSAMYEIGAKDIIEKILPVVDNFERGFNAVSEEEKATPFAEGMDKIFKQLLKVLEDTGVKEIDALGKEFDPNLHNAVMHVEDESFGENVVAEVLQKGYLYRDTVVRHSMVKVAN